MADLWIPPPGLRVRIVSALCKRVLYANRRNNDTLNNSGRDPKYEDHWFTLTPHDSRYLIKSTYTSQYVYANRGKAGLAGDQQLYADMIFTLEPGNGPKQGTCRLLCQETGMGLFSRDTADPPVGITGFAPAYDDMYFWFEPEDLNLVDIEYDIKNAKILSSVPKTGSRSETTNNTDTPQDATIALSETVSQTWTWNTSVMFEISISMKSEVSLPGVAKEEITVGLKMARTFSTGESKTEAKTWTGTAKTTVPPHKKYRCTTQMSQVTFEVPYKTIWKSKGTGVYCEGHGVYKGLDQVVMNVAWDDITNSAQEIRVSEAPVEEL